MLTFDTFQPGTIRPTRVTPPHVFNGLCLIKKYRVTVAEIEEPKEVLIARLQDLWERRRELRITHSSNTEAMRMTAMELGIILPS